MPERHKLDFRGERMLIGGREAIKTPEDKETEWWRSKRTQLC